MTGASNHQVFCWGAEYESQANSDGSRNLNHITNLWHVDADKRAMPFERSQPCHLPCANSLTLVPAGTTECIAAGDCQAAVPFHKEVGRDFELRWKIASSLSYFLLQLGSNDGAAGLPEKGAMEATSCPKGGNMWRHWYGLTEAWRSTTYDWTLGQILPRCREESCQQSLTEYSVKGKTRAYREGNLTMEEYTYGITRGESGHTDN